MGIIQGFLGNYEYTYCLEASFPYHKNIHGEVVNHDQELIKDALVEQITLYPKEHALSDSRIMRRGLLVQYPQAKATILICHGFMCDKFDVGFLRYLFPKGEYNFMTFDFRAHGESNEGQFCTFGRDEAHDVIAAGSFLRSHPAVKDKPLFVYGFSMGAVAAIEGQSQEKKLFDAMILDCPFDSSENIIKKCLQNLKLSFLGYEFELPCRTLLEKYAFHPYVQTFVKILLKTVANIDPKNISTFIYPVTPVESIKKVSVPCFFIHCKNDEKVSIDSVKSIYNGASGYKTLWLTNGRHHFDSFFYNPEKYTRKIHKFLEHVMQGTLYQKEQKKIIEDADEPNNILKALQGI